MAVFPVRLAARFFSFHPALLDLPGAVTEKVSANRRLEQETWETRRKRHWKPSPILGTSGDESQRDCRTADVFAVHRGFAHAQFPKDIKAKLRTRRSRISIPIGPVESEFPKPRPHIRDVPDLQTALVHADGQMPAIRTEGQRERAARQLEQWLEMARVIQTAGEKVSRQPAGPGVRRVKDAQGVREYARPLPGCGAPKIDLLARGDCHFITRWRELKRADADRVVEFRDLFQSRQRIHVQRRRVGTVNPEPSLIGRGAVDSGRSPRPGSIGRSGIQCSEIVQAYE